MEFNQSQHRGLCWCSPASSGSRALLSAAEQRMLQPSSEQLLRPWTCGKQGVRSTCFWCCPPSLCRFFLIRRPVGLLLILHIKWHLKTTLCVGSSGILLEAVVHNKCQITFIICVFEVSVMSEWPASHQNWQKQRPINRFHLYISWWCLHCWASSCSMNMAVI